MMAHLMARRPGIGSHQCLSIDVVAVEVPVVAQLLRARPMVHLAMASRLEAMVR